MSQSQSVRAVLFADMTLDDLLAQVSATSEPWASFAEASSFLRSGKTAAAQAALHKIAETGSYEPRVTLQAWHVLRSLGEVPPPAIATKLLGVVVEVGMSAGVDLLAAYADCTARYYNYSGSAVVWERPNSSLDASILEVLLCGMRILPNIGLWNHARRGPPGANVVRINMLTPAGLYFGEGPFSVLARDSMSAPVVAAATALMKNLTQLTTGDAKASSPRRGT